MALAKSFDLYWWISFAPGYEIVNGIDYIIGYVIDDAIGHINDKVKIFELIIALGMCY